MIGLRDTASMPDEYRLSHILFSYRQGIRGSNRQTMSIGVETETIKDGVIDFIVPKPCGPCPSLWRRLTLAWQVLCGRASILYYF